MKFLATYALFPAVMAFPAAMLEAFERDPQLMARAEELMARQAGGAGAASAVFEPAPKFNAAAQLIDVGPGSGHEYQDPGPKDLRGPCPGLNAFANHGFLPRNGYGTIDDFINATTYVVGMGPDLATFLGIYGTVTSGGDLNAWSIGGTPPPGVGGLLAQRGKGLIGAHNKYELDVSPTRPDLYQYGNNFIPRVQQFQELIDLSPGGIVTLDTITKFRSNRFQESLSGNPYFFNGPFSGLVLQSATYTFIYRFMANHTAAAPLGVLTYDTLQSWFAIPGTSGNYRVEFGKERIPNNWYKRDPAAPYSIPYFLSDTLVAGTIYPQLLSVGGNVDNKTNNFVGVDTADLSGGLFRSADLLKGNNLGCFAYQAAGQFRSDSLTKDLLNKLQAAVGRVVTQLGCPQLQKFDADYLDQFPGYTKGNSGNGGLLGLLKE